MNSSSIETRLEKERSYGGIHSAACSSGNSNPCSPAQLVAQNSSSPKWKLSLRTFNLRQIKQQDRNFIWKAPISLSRTLCFMFAKRARCCLIYMLLNIITKVKFKNSPEVMAFLISHKNKMSANYLNFKV